MQLVHVDTIELQPLQAPLDGFAQVIRAGIMNPLVRSYALPTALGRDHQPLRIRVQRFRDQFFADVGAIRIRGIDEIDAQFHCAPQHADGAVVIFRWTPNALSRNAHGAITHAIDREFAA